MSRPRSMYVVSMRSIFHFQPRFSLSLIRLPRLNRLTCFLYIFKNVFYNFWMIMWMKKANNLQIAKIQPQGTA